MVRSFKSTEKPKPKEKGVLDPLIYYQKDVINKHRECIGYKGSIIPIEKECEPYKLVKTFMIDSKETYTNQELAKMVCEQMIDESTIKVDRKLIMNVNLSEGDLIEYRVEFNLIKSE